MDNKKDNLDNVIKNAVGTNNSKFDFQQFKNENPELIEQYRSKSPKRFVFINTFTKLAAAAVILISAGLLIYNINKEDNIQSPPVASMINRLQLTLAYAQGGMDGLDQQYEDAYTKLGPRTGDESLNSLLNEL